MFARWAVSGALLVVLLAWGCGRGEPAAAPAVSAESAPAAKHAPPPPPPKPKMVEKKAEVGVGKQGHYDTSGPASIITVPVASLFAARQRRVFEVQIPQAMQLFQATEGRLPKSHEEFMARIVEENRLVLPELPEEHRYRYDPEAGQLMVEHPSR